MDRRTEELDCDPVAGLFSALETFRFRDNDSDGAVEGEVSGSVLVEADDAAEARAAWLAAWRAEDLVILGDMRNWPRDCLLARAWAKREMWERKAGRRVEIPAAAVRDGCG